VSAHERVILVLRGSSAAAGLLVLCVGLVLPKPWPLLEPATGVLQVTLLLAVITLVLTVSPRRLLVWIGVTELWIAVWAIMTLLSLWVSVPRQPDPVLLDIRLEASIYLFLVLAMCAAGFIAWAMAVSGAPLRDWRRWLRTSGSRPPWRLD